MEEAKWYVVHTFSGYENKVKVDIEKTVRTGIFRIRFSRLRFPFRK